VFEAEMDRPFGLNEGQTAVIPSEQLEITYGRIVEDTRCPGGVDCESRGELVIEYEVVKKERSLGRFALGSNSSPPSMAATRPTNSPSRGLGMVNDV
jgi:hypothetical protein